MCTCASCENTDSLHGWKTVEGKTVPDLEKGGFANWPTGNPAGPRGSARDYAAHVAHSMLGARKRVDFGPAGAGFYGTPAGMTKAQVDEVLRRTFADVQEPRLHIVEKPTQRSLLELARELRKAA